MLPLLLVVHIFLGATIAGSAVIAALTLGFDTITPIVAAAAIGFLATFPASWYVARKLNEL